MLAAGGDEYIMEPFTRDAVLDKPAGNPLNLAMSAPIRIFLVDDSAVIRRLLTDVLSGDPALEVADSAANGRIALAKLLAVKPDIVILDVEMPEMDGLETLAEIRKRQPRR